MKNKRGWLRIMEAIIAVLILSSVMIILYINNSPRVSYSAIIFDAQTKILEGIALNDQVRNKTVFANSTQSPQEVIDYVNSSLDDRYNFYVKICNLDEPNCNYFDQSTANKEVFVEDRIIGGNIYNSTSKLVRLYIWE